MSDYRYVEHFSIDESARNGGLGVKAVITFINQSDLPIVLEVERPNDEMSKRRIGFYERLGFQLHTHDYSQPPYRAADDWLPMRLMSFGEIDMNERYEHVKSHIHKHVYQVMD